MEEPPFDPPMSEEQTALANALPEDMVHKIDEALLKVVSENWRKVARIVGTVMVYEKWLPDGIPDLYYAQRVRHLVDAGFLEAAGDLRMMGRSEVRLPQK